MSSRADRLHFLSEQEECACSVMPHLDVVLIAEVRKRLARLDALTAELGQSANVVHAAAGHDFREQEAVFERRVHSLSVERCARVCRVSDDAHAASGRVVGVALDLQQGAVGAGAEVSDQVGHEGNDVGKVAAEVGEDLLVALDAVEALGPFERKE